MSRYCSCHRPVVKEVKFDVNADPETYRPNMHVSPHLEFVKANTQYFEDRIEHLIDIVDDYGLDSDMPDAVFFWLENQKRKEVRRVEQLIEREHDANAYLLAERVIHKFMKWGPVRFGLTPACQNDFYDGSRAIDSLDNPVRFEPVFRTHVLKLARKYGLSGDQILRNLHVGPTSAQRFYEFIDVDIPVIDTNADAKVDDEADCDCFLCAHDSDSDESESESESDEDIEVESEDEKIEQSPSETLNFKVTSPKIPVPHAPLD